MFYQLGKLIHRRRWVVLAAAGLFLAAAIGLWVRGGELTAGKIAGLEADRADQLLADVVGHDPETTFALVLRWKGAEAPPRDALMRAVGLVLDPLREDPRVAAVRAPASGPVPGGPRVSEDGRAALALVTLAGDFKQALGAYPGLREGMASDAVELAATGRVPFNHDLNRALERDLVRAELISLPLALLVLLLVFRTAVAAALPVGVGGLAVLGGIALVFVASHGTDVAQYAINVCSLVGLGVAIDYSLFTVARFREERAAGYPVPEALARTTERAGKVVVFSAAAVILGLSGLFFFEGSYLRTMGFAGVGVVALAALFAITFLPALLAVLGPKVEALKLPLPRLPFATGAWERLADWVMKRPVLVLVPTLAVLLGLGIPALKIRLAASDVSVLPAGLEARVGHDLLRAHFPDDADARFDVAVQFPSEPALTPERAGALYDLSKRIAALPQVRKVQSVALPDPRMTREQVQAMVASPPSPQAAAALAGAVKGNVVLVQAISGLAPETAEAQELVRAIRADRVVADGTLLVGGESALNVDTTRYMLARAPWAVGFVVLSTFVVLLLVLGSVVLPVKALLMNALSLCGAYGALVWLFQEGHLVSATPRPVEPALPVLLFCVLFGLSMDYEVLILSRMKEAYDRTRDNRRAVAEGLAKTGRLVTSAAAIMVAVFLAFGLADVVLIQAVGVGMAVAVALDATLVRVLLVPSTMRLFGDANWWEPRWLRAIRQALGLEHQPPHVGPPARPEVSPDFDA